MVKSEPTASDKEIGWVDEAEGDGRGALVGIARDVFPQAFEPGLSELEVVDLPEETP